MIQLLVLDYFFYVSNLSRLSYREILTNDHVRPALGLKPVGHHELDVPPPSLLESYFREYSTSAKAYRTQDGTNELFRELVKFLLEVPCVHPSTYSMSKKKVGFIIATYQRDLID